MLHYHIDHEVMSDLYRDFCRLRESGYDELHALGQCYLPLREIYELDKKTCDAIRLLCEFQTETELKELENRLVHGYVDASTDLRNEQAE